MTLQYEKEGAFYAAQCAEGNVNGISRKADDTYYATDGTYENGDLVICEKCGQTFVSHNDEDYCRFCR